MAVNNRDEAIISVNTDMVPTISALELRTLLNDEIINSIVFRKDVIASETPIAGAVVINYLNKDTATVTTAVNLAVSFTDIENGDVKYLHITKAAANTISFVGALDTSMNKAYINAVATVVVYQIACKNGIILVNSLNIDDNLHGGAITKYIDLPVWNMDTTNSVSVTIPIIPFGKMLNMDALIYADVDAATSIYAQDIGGNLGGIIGFGGGLGFVTITRVTGGRFDNAGYSTRPTKRGILKIEYLP